MAWNGPSLLQGLCSHDISLLKWPQCSKEVAIPLHNLSLYHNNLQLICLKIILTSIPRFGLWYNERCGGKFLRVMKNSFFKGEMRLQNNRNQSKCFIFIKLLKILCSISPHLWCPYCVPNFVVKTLCLLTVSMPPTILREILI